MANGDFENPPMSEVPGLLYVGCGIGSWANEHYGSEPDKSACFLVARELQVDHRRYRKLVELVTQEDRYGSGGIKNHIAQSIKDLYDMGWSFERVHKWMNHLLVALSNWNPASDGELSLDTDTCIRAIEKKFGKQFAKTWASVLSDIQKWNKGEFIRACAYLRKNPSFFKEVETYKGKMKAFIPDEVQTNIKIGQAARSMGAEIVLMQSALDFNQIGIVLQQKQSAGLSFSLVLEQTRQQELIQRGTMNEKKLKQCAGEGTLEVCPIWHGHQAATGQNECFAIYNRSKSRPCIPQTSMPWEYIVDIVTLTLGRDPHPLQVKEPIGGVPENFLTPRSLDEVLKDQLQEVV